MAKNHLNTNKQFMIGNGLLAFAVIIVVAIFVYLGFRTRNPEEIISYTESYIIELKDGFRGSSVAVYINDSLLLDRQIDTDSLQLEVNRFAEQNALLIVDNETDKLTTFDLSEKGGTIILRKEDDRIYMEGR